MKSFLLALAFAVPAAALAQASVQQIPNEPGYTLPGGNKSQPPKLTEKGRAFSGEVMSVDKAAGFLTLKHRSIDMLGVPAGTVEFSPKDRSVLDHVKVGDRVLFNAVLQGRSLKVTEVAPN